MAGMPRDVRAGPAIHPRMTRGWRALNHTADLALAVWADSEPALLAQAARALVSVMTEDARPGPRRTYERRALTLEALDPEDRLVRWLNEVIYLAVSEGFLTREADVRLEGAGLSADLAGERGTVATELKSVTYHDLRLAADGDRWRARFVVDV
jgi:SHS2 domain-containing protein